MWKLDKLLASVILLAMLGFGTVIFYSTVQSRHVQAVPVQVIPEPVPEVEPVKTKVKRLKKRIQPQAQKPKRPRIVPGMNSTEYRRTLERREGDPLVLPPLK